MIKLISKLGPGLLFAGAAIGVSHLVQSTRAGADFGWGLIWALILSQTLLHVPYFCVHFFSIDLKDPEHQKY